jgi:hypothetical protein
VSPSFRNQIQLGLAPNRVTMQRVARGWRPQPAALEQRACELAAHAEPAWRPALAALAALLPETGLAGSDATLVLSNHFVRFVLVPMHAQLVRPADDLALARHEFLQAYGPAARDWTLQVSDDGRGRGPRLACAIDSALLEALRALCRARKLALLSLQPWLMHAFNQWRAQLDPNGGLVLVEPGRLCVVRFHQGHWQAVSNRRIGADWLQELTTLRDRERLLAGSAGAAPVPLQVYAPDFPPPSAEQQRQHPELTWLPTTAAAAVDNNTAAGKALASGGT